MFPAWAAGPSGGRNRRGVKGVGSGGREKMVLALGV